MPAFCASVLGLNIGTRVIDSTPAAMTTSIAPDITAWAAKCSACWVSALAIHRSARHGVGQGRGQHRIARDIGRLLPDMADAAKDDVFDECRISVRTSQQAVEDLCREVNGMPTGEAAATATAGGAKGSDDIGVGHEAFLGFSGAG